MDFQFTMYKSEINRTQANTSPNNFFSLKHKRKFNVLQFLDHLMKKISVMAAKETLLVFSIQ